MRAKIPQLRQGPPSRAPAINASSICRAETPRMSGTTESSLIPASSSSFWIRWVSRARSSISFLR